MGPGVPGDPPSRPTSTPSPESRLTVGGAPPPAPSRRPAVCLVWAVAAFLTYSVASDVRLISRNSFPASQVKSRSPVGPFRHARPSRGSLAAPLRALGAREHANHLVARSASSVAPPPVPRPVPSALLAVAAGLAATWRWARQRRRIVGGPSTPTVWATLQLTADFDPNHDYYADLGVSAEASQDDIRKAFRRLVREQHPDIAGSNANPTRFIAIKRAYDILSSPPDRQRYNSYRAFGRPVLRRTAAAAPSRPRPPRPAPAGPAPRPQQQGQHQQKGGGGWFGNLASWGLQLFQARPAAAAAAPKGKFDEDLAKTLLSELIRQGFTELPVRSQQSERLFTRPYRRWDLLVCTALQATRDLRLVERENQSVRVCAVSKGAGGSQNVSAGPVYLSYFNRVPRSTFVASVRESLQQVQDELGRNVMYGG